MNNTPTPEIPENPDLTPDIADDSKGDPPSGDTVLEKNEWIERERAAITKKSSISPLEAYEQSFFRNIPHIQNYQGDLL